MHTMLLKTFNILSRSQQNGDLNENGLRESRDTSIYTDTDELVENHLGETSRDRDRRQHLMKRYYDRDRLELRRRGRSSERDPKLEWYFVAQVIDKLLLYVFCVAMSAVITVSLLIVPWMNRVQ